MRKQLPPRRGEITESFGIIAHELGAVVVADPRQIARQFRAAKIDSRRRNRQDRRLNSITIHDFERSGWRPFRKRNATAFCFYAVLLDGGQILGREEMMVRVNSRKDHIFCSRINRTCLPSRNKDPVIADSGNKTDGSQRISRRIASRFTIESDEDAIFVAECPALPGCISQGRTRDEAMANIRDAIQGYVKSLKKHGDTNIVVTKP
jgi:antitoxin HicB